MLPCHALLLPSAIHAGEGGLCRTRDLFRSIRGMPGPGWPQLGAPARLRLSRPRWLGRINLYFLLDFLRRLFPQLLEQ